MNRKNWLELSRKLVTRFDLDYSMASMTEYFAKLWYGLVGQGVFNSYKYAAPFLLTPSGSTMVVGVAPGCAYDSIGQLIDVPTADSITLVSNSGQDTWGYLVARWVYKGDSLIPKPSDPLTSVYENLVDSYQLAFVPGTPTAYPVKDARDVILCGVKVPAGAIRATQCTFDYSVSEIAYQAADTFDNRLRPFKAGNKILGIQPSQTYGGANAPKRFTFLGINRPSIYPKSSSGKFNAQPTFVNLENMGLSGGDETSSLPAPLIPSTGQALVATVYVKPDDTLHIAYGTMGSLAQCRDAITNQYYSGAGSLAPYQPFFLLAYVVIRSTTGATISDIEVTDARPYGPVATISVLKQEVPVGVVNGANNIFQIQNTPVDSESVVVMVDGYVVPKSSYTIADKIITMGSAPALAQDVYVFYLVNAIGSFGAFQGSGGNALAAMKHEVPTGVVDGVNAIFYLSALPSNAESVGIMIDGTMLKKSEYTVSGQQVVLVVPPELAQGIDAFYLVNTGGTGGGGGGGGSASVVTMYPVLSSGNIASKSLTLPYTPGDPSSVLVDQIGGVAQAYGADFTVSGNVLSWAGLALDGQLQVGDQLRIFYLY